MEKIIILLALTSIATCGNLNNEYLPPKEGSSTLNSVFRPTFRNLQTTNGNGFQPQGNGFLAGRNNAAFPKSQFTPVTSQQQYSNSVAPKLEYGAVQKSAVPEGETGSVFAQQASAAPRLQSGASFSSQNQFNAPVATLYGAPLAPQKASVLPNFQPSFQQFGAPTTQFQSGPSFSRQYETDDAVITDSVGPSFRVQPLAKTQFAPFGSQQFGQAPAAIQYNGPQQQYGVPSTFGSTSQFGGRALFRQYPTSQIGDSSVSEKFSGRKFQHGVSSTLHRPASVFPKQQYGTVQDGQGGYKY